MRINHNISALNAYRNLSINAANSSKSLEKLSSGLRINRASDDAAGLAISEKMRSQIRGLDMAERNALDGISLIQTAEGALSSSHEILQRMRELAVQASNDTNTESDRAEIQKEVNQLTSELNRIGSATEFNKAALLNGSRVNTFEANGKSFAGGVTSVTDPITGLNLAISNGAALEKGPHSLLVTKTDIGVANPANVVPAKGLFGAVGDAAAGEIGITENATADQWTLTTQKGKPVTFTGGQASYVDPTTGVSVTLTDDSALAGGNHQLTIFAVERGLFFPGGTSEYKVDLKKSELGGTGTGIASFSNDAIAFGVDNGVPVFAGAVTLTNTGPNTFKISGSGINDTYTVGTQYNHHGLRFTMDSTTGFNVNDTVTLTVAPGTGVIGTKTVGFAAGNSGANNITFTNGLTVDNSVEEGTWTLEKLATGWKVDFAGLNGSTYTHTLTSNTEAFDSHGVSFKVATVGMNAGDKITFDTKSPQTFYDVVADLDGQQAIIAKSTTATGTPGDLQFTGALSNVEPFPGFQISSNGIKEGIVSFTTEAAIADKLLLSNSNGLKTATIVAGQPFNQFGMQLQFNGAGTLVNGEQITFSTDAPKALFQYELSFDNGAAMIVDPSVVEGHNPVLLGFNGVGGLELNSLELKTGNFRFNVEETGTGVDGSVHLQIGANQGQTVALEINDMRASALRISTTVAGGLGQPIELLNGDIAQAWYTNTAGSSNGISSENSEFALDVTTSEKAAAAISVFDDAIQRVSSERSRLGAIQNRLEYTVDNLKIMSENITTSESRIRDLDMALEMTEFTKNNILNQAAQAMLSQANQMPQGVLQLLK